MKIVIIGGVAAGTKAAAKMRREMPDSQVEIYTKSQNISYAGCGLPYYIGGEIENYEELIVNSPDQFTGLTGAVVHTGQTAVSLDPIAGSVRFRAVEDGSEQNVAYDKLVIATGAEPMIPHWDGVDKKGVFTVRVPEDAQQIRQYIQHSNCKRAVVIGAGFIGVEMAENLSRQHLAVTVVEMKNQILSQAYDPDMAGTAAKHMRSQGIKILTGAMVQAVRGDEAVTAVSTNAGDIPADVVILCIGVRPATQFLCNSGIEMVNGAIVVDQFQKTNFNDIYAAGDCVLVRNCLTGARQYAPMGSIANITGRSLAKTIAGTQMPYGGCLGTSVIKISDHLNGGRTGLTEEQAKDAGYDVTSVTFVTSDKGEYYPDSDLFVIKVIADRKTMKFLGLQVLGSGAVDKMTDIAVVGLSAGLKISDFDTMDFAYAPPFSTAIHPFVKACYILENKIRGALESFTPAEYLSGAAKDYRVLDAQPSPKIFGATWIDPGKVHGPIDGIALDEKLLIVCAKGRKAYLLQNKLKSYGYRNTKVLEGGTYVNAVRVENAVGKIPPEEIKRVKGLGCLQDKRYTDVFNVRVITRNGKITTADQRVIADAADRFGSGEVTMTTRLTMEIQGVRYENIDALLAYLNEHNLLTGGTGSRVRPVVSCKGTTCQYGLIDTYGLSEKIHERFYIGYHDVTLPHKFKIAVGGCPNNCVKPDLNDLGIIGQRVPSINPGLCRGCKVCQIEKACPIKSAHIENGKITNGVDCNNCGRCKGKCPFGAISEFTDGYKVYIGGRWGKKTANGRPLDRLFTSEDEVLDLVERAILFFRDEGITGERFADTVSRLGFEYVQDKLLNQNIDKNQILNKKVKGGATC